MQSVYDFEHNWMSPNQYHEVYQQKKASRAGMHPEASTITVSCSELAFGVEEIKLQRTHHMGHTCSQSHCGPHGSGLEGSC